MKQNNSLNEIRSLLTIVLVIVVVIIGAYLFTANFVVGPKKYNVNEPANTIYGSQTFKVDDYIYYVLFIDTEDYTSKKVYQNLLNGKFEENLYIVDLSKEVNKKFIAEESNLNTSKIEDLKVKETTLLKIENEKIISKTEGLTNIVGEIN